MVKEVINVDGVVWTITEIKDGLPIFVSEEGIECSPIFDSDYEYENVNYLTLLVETENDEWLDTFWMRDTADREFDSFEVVDGNIRLESLTNKI